MSKRSVLHQLLRNSASFTKEEYTVSGSNLVDRVKQLSHEGNVTRVIVRIIGKTLLDIPATIGVVAVIIAPWLVALGVIAALITNCKNCG
jgi:hypothetical protein